MAYKCFKADLHVHTCLSPCAELDLSPLGVVQAALAKGLDLIGVCDHNSAENVSAVKKAGSRRGLGVLGGMEVNTSEEVHTLVFFEHDADLIRFQGIIYDHLDGVNDEQAFGEQVIADEEDGVVGFCKRLLIGATSLSLEAVIRTAREVSSDSLVIAAHGDREASGVIGQLGFIPPGLDLDAVEISSAVTPAAARERFPDFKRYPLITGSDAHRPEDVGGRFTTFRMEEGTVAEVRKALAGVDGRSVHC